MSSEGDSDALADNLLSLLNRRDEWGKMGQAGRAFVEKNHNIDTEIRNLEDKYNRLVTGIKE